jgi:hypothetical protein
MRSYWIIQVGTKSNASTLVRDTQRRVRAGYMKMEADIEVTLSQTKEYLVPPEVG